MTFTKKEREAICDLITKYVDCDLTKYSDKRFWTRLQTKLDAWAALHGEGQAAINRARKRLASRVNKRLANAGKIK